MSVNSRILRIFNGHKRQLIPIAMDGPSSFKRPLHKQWTTQSYSVDEIGGYALRGLNLGWRLTETDVVIDVDVKNDGLAGLAVLLADFQQHGSAVEDLGDVFPTVKTGGGGYHYYAAIPPGTKIRNSIERYGKGVEFKSVGRQVIIPGSVHPSGNGYSFDDFSDATGPAPMLPGWLIDLVKRPIITRNPIASSGSLTVTQLKELLAQLDAADYATNDEWFPLMASAHEATGGAGVDVFVEWSLSDDSFVGHDEVIRHRWSSFRPGQTGNISAGTLFKEVTQRGGTLPPIAVDMPAVQSMGDLPPATPYVPPLSDAPINRYTSTKELDAMVQSLDPQSSADEIKAVLVEVAKRDPLDRDVYVRAIKTQTGRPLPGLKAALATVRARAAEDGVVDVDDVCLEINTLLLHKRFDGGRNLVHGADQRFWEFSGTHWQVVEDNMVEQLLLKASYNHKQHNPQITTPLVPLIASGVRLLRARQASKQNLHMMPGQRPPVVNTRNCEVWVDTATGLVTPKPHAPESYLTSCLDTDFNPRAKCPVFSLALQQMFALCPDRDEVIRHLWEVIGYAIQPQKNIASWVLFHGGGANGKTVVLSVLNKLLGKACLNKSIDELDTKRNGHALADLPGKLCVIDEDLDAKTTLPDSILKKVSEAKTLTANPKSRATFDFWNQAIVIFASNEYPKVKDLSNGMRRRALVFDFNRTFAVHEQDPNLSKTIADTEMSGVLIEALKGHGRLRARGGWDVPQSCRQAKDKWMIASNTVSLFVSEMICPGGPADQLSYGQLYNIYRLWCMENGYSKQSTKPNFGAAIKALGLPIIRGAKNQMIVKGVTLADHTIDMENL